MQALQSQTTVALKSSEVDSGENVHLTLRNQISGDSTPRDIVIKLSDGEQ